MNQLYVLLEMVRLLFQHVSYITIGLYQGTTLESCGNVEFQKDQF